MVLGIRESMGDGVPKRSQSNDFGNIGKIYIAMIKIPQKLYARDMVGPFSINTVRQESQYLKETILPFFIE